MNRMPGKAAEQGEQRLTPFEERQLIDAARGGCAVSSRRLVETHQDRLFAFVWKMTRDSHDAEEVCQDAFLRAFQALDSFDNRFRFSTWLFTIAYRLCLNQMRRRRDLSGDMDFSRVSDDAADGSDDASESVANREAARVLRQKIWESVNRLSAPQRAAVLLFYRESMDCQEIGEVLNMPAATVKSHLHRARAKLKDLLADRLNDDWMQIRFDGVSAEAV